MRCSPKFERLEDRRMLSMAAMDIGLSSGEEMLSVRAATLSESDSSSSSQAGPLPQAPSQDTGGGGGGGGGAPAPASIPVGPLANPPAFPVFDTTFGAGDVAPGMQDIYWAGQPPFSDNGAYAPDRPHVEALAALVRDGGTAVNGQQVTAGEFSVVDFELSQANSPGYMLRRMQWFRKEARNINISMYGYFLVDNGLNRDEVIDSTRPDHQAIIDKNILERGPIARRLNSISIDCYMLGPNEVDRDLAYLQKIAELTHKAFPDRPVYAWAWGAYHTTWNPVGAVLPPDVMQRYVDTIKRNFDGVVVWGPKSDNTLFTQMLMSK